MPEVFSAFIALVFTGKVFCQSSPVPVLKAESGEMKYYSWQKQIYLKSIISKHMGLGKMHPKVLANVIVSLFSIIFERSWRLLMTWKKVNVTCIFKNGKKEKLGKWQVILTPVLERLWSKSSLKTAQMHSDTCRTRGWLGTASTGKKKRNHTWHTWLPFMMRGQEKSSSCQAPWFSTEFGNLFCSILIAKLMRYGPDGLSKHPKWMLLARHVE